MSAPALPPFALDLYARALAAGTGGLLEGLRRTCDVVIRDADRLPPDGAPRLYCYWHENALSGFVYLLGLGSTTRLAALCHPVWYLKQWELLARHYGWGIVMGSTGHRGREAADELVGRLRDGCSTFVCPDGPRGPAHEAKRGVVHMALQSGAPIVPLAFRHTRAIALPTWDGMRLATPGSRIEVHVGAPIHVRDADDVEPALAAATRAMHGADASAQA